MTGHSIERALAEELREYTAMKYAGDCKCGKCQLVPRALVERIYHTLNSSAVRQPCPGCDGHECDKGCAYSGATGAPRVSPGSEGLRQQIEESIRRHVAARDGGAQLVGIGHAAIEIATAFDAAQSAQMAPALRSTLEDIIAAYEWCSVDPIDRGYSTLDSEIYRAKRLLAGVSIPSTDRGGAA